MGTLHCSNVEFATNPPIPSEIKVGVRFTPVPLQRWGINIPVIIRAGSAYSNSGNVDNAPLPTAMVRGHLDTGAHITVIDTSLAVHLGLKSTGIAQIRTAGGVRDASYFIIDLHFANSTLTPVINLSVASTDLGFNINRDLIGNPQSFGILIGRDVMASWNIVWSGPTSTVIIND